MPFSISIGDSTFQLAFIAAKSGPSSFCSRTFSSAFSRSLISYGYFPADFLSVKRTLGVAGFSSKSCLLTVGLGLAVAVGVGFAALELSFLPLSECFSFLVLWCSAVGFTIETLDRRKFSPRQTPFVIKVDGIMDIKLDTVTINPKLDPATFEKKREMF